MGTPSRDLTFEEALMLLKQGKRVARRAWSSVSATAFIFVVPGSRFTVNQALLLGIFPEGTVIDYQPHIDICDGRKTGVYLPGMVDIFAVDWYEVLDQTA